MIESQRTVAALWGARDGVRGEGECVSGRGGLSMEHDAAMSNTEAKGLRERAAGGGDMAVGVGYAALCEIREVRAVV